MTPGDSSLARAVSLPLVTMSTARWSFQRAALFSLLARRCLRSFHCLFERRAGGEARRLASGDLDLLAGLGVDALAGGALAYFKGAEARECHLLAAGQRLADHGQCGLDDQLGLFLADAGLFRDGFDEVRFLHPAARFRLGACSNAVTADSSVGYRSIRYGR